MSRRREFLRPADDVGRAELGNDWLERAFAPDAPARQRLLAELVSYLEEAGYTMTKPLSAEQLALFSEAETLYTTLNQYYVILEVNPSLQLGPNALSRIYATSSSGGEVPLSQFATVTQTIAPIAVNYPTRMPEDELRENMILCAKHGVEIIISVGGDPTELIKRVQPAVLVKGADYTRDEVVGGDVVEAAGGTVMLVDLVPGHSTTGLVRRSAESTS